MNCISPGAFYLQAFMRFRAVQGEGLHELYALPPGGFLSGAHIGVFLPFLLGGILGGIPTSKKRKRKFDVFLSQLDLRRSAVDSMGLACM